MTIRIDVDDDGTTDAKLPLKWAIIVGAIIASSCGLSQFFL